MFRLKVLAQDGVEFTFLNTVHYRTLEGELDIMDMEGVVTNTFADGEWIKVSREKDEDDDWPRAVLRNIEFVDESEEEDSEDDYKESLIRGGERIGLLDDLPANILGRPRGIEDHELP